jgi:hypothetical protein
MSKPSEKEIERYRALAEVAVARNADKKTKKRAARHSLQVKRTSAAGPSPPFMMYAAELAKLDDESTALIEAQKPKADEIPPEDRPDLFDDLSDMLEREYGKRVMLRYCDKKDSRYELSLCILSLLSHIRFCVHAQGCV